MQFSVGSISPILASFSWIFSLRVTLLGAGVLQGSLPCSALVPVWSPGRVRGPAGLFKELLDRRGMQLRPQGTQELTGRLLLQAEAPGKDVDWGPLEVNRIIGSGTLNLAPEPGPASCSSQSRDHCMLQAPAAALSGIPWSGPR